MSLETRSELPASVTDRAASLHEGRLVELSDLQDFQSLRRSAQGIQNDALRNMGFPDEGMLLAVSADSDGYNPFRKINNALERAGRSERAFETVRGGERVAAKDGSWGTPTIRIHIDGKEREIDMNLPGLKDGHNVRLESNGRQLRAIDPLTGQRWHLDATVYPWKYSFRWEPQK